MDTYITATAAFVSFASMLFTIFFSNKSMLREQNAIKLERFNVIQTYRARVTSWATEVVAVMSECTILCELDPAMKPDFFEERNRLRTRLSELIDRGRWLFESDKATSHGKRKRKVNQGIAPESIDCIKRILGLVESLNYKEKDGNANLRQPIVDVKKDFVNVIYIFVEPGQSLAELDALKSEEK